MRKRIILISFLAALTCTSFCGKPFFPPSAKRFAGIEVGAKGVKFILLDIITKKKAESGFKILKDSSVNTDFISFTEPALLQTCAAVTSLYRLAKNEFKLPASKIFTVISSGVQQSADYNNKKEFINRLINIFTALINEPERDVPVISPEEESEYSMMGAVGDNILTETLLLDIGSGNTKGGFYNESPDDFVPCYISWGTKSISNEVNNKTADVNTAENFVASMDDLFKQSVIKEVNDMVNSRAGVVEKTNNFISGGIAWALMNCIKGGRNPGGDFIKIKLADIIGFREKIRHAFLTDRLNAAFFTAAVPKGKKKKIFTAVINEVFKVYNEKDLVCGTELVYTIVKQLTAEGCTGPILLTTKGKYGWMPGYIISNYQLLICNKCPAE